MSFRNFSIAALVLLFSIAIAFAEEAKFPAPSGFVVDDAGIIDAATLQKIKTLCGSAPTPSTLSHNRW